MAMFIMLEMWKEKLRDDGSPQVFGHGAGARLDMRAMEFQRHPINIHAILSFEKIEIRTDGRPGSADNHGDALYGVRICLMNGSSTVIIDDSDPVFAKQLASAAKADGLVWGSGKSAYMQKFAPTRT